MSRKINLHIRIFLLFILVIFNRLYKAQDSTSYKENHTLGEVIVEANKLQTKLKDISTQIEIIDKIKIERTNGSRLPDILKNSTSAFIKSYGITPSLQTISINGLGAEHTLVLIDGVKVNSFQNSQIDLSIIPLHNIERIEIVNNGLSSIYGSDALGGIVNIVTKTQPLLTDNGNTQFKLSLTSGSYNTKGYLISLSRQSENFNLEAYYNNENSDGNFNYYYNNGIEKILKERENASYNLFDTGINAQYFINNFNRVRLISSYSYQNKNVPGIETGTPPAKTKQTDKYWNNILISENVLSSFITLYSSLSFQNSFMNYKLNKVLNNSYKNIVLSGSSELRLNDKNYSVTTGYNYSYAALKSNALEKGIKRNQYAVFLSSVYQLFENTKLFPSARYDYISDIKKDAFTYKFGINYQPFDKVDFSIKGNFGRNFRSPSFNDLYWKESGNKNLKPENSTNIETGLFYSFNSFVKGRIEIGYTQIYAKDKIVWKPRSDGLWTPKNIDESISQSFSINIAAERRFKQRWLFIINAGIKSINSKKTGESYPGDITKNKFIPYTPLLSSNLGIFIQYDFTELNIFYLHTGERYSDFANKIKLDAINTVDCNFIINTKIWEVSSKIKLEVNNVFNTEYEIISGYPMPLRNFKLTLTLNY